MKETLSILKHGVVNADYPYYGSYIYFGDDIRATNGNVYITLSNKFPISGCINFFTLSNVLNNCETPSITQEKNILKIKDGKFETSLMIEDMDYPILEELDVDFIKVNEEFLELLKTGIKYTGEGLYSYIYIDKNYILATCNKQKAFYCKHTFDVPNIIGVNKKIMAVLSEGIELGTTEYNTVVKFDGTMVFKIALLDNYPTKHIIDLFESKPRVKKLCNIALLQDAVKKVSSVLVNEKSKTVKLTNKNNVLEIKAESAINGSSVSKISSELEDAWKLDIDVSFLSGIELDYDVFVSDISVLFLSNGKSEIAMVGTR